MLRGKWIQSMWKYYHCGEKWPVAGPTRKQPFSLLWPAVPVCQSCHKKAAASSRAAVGCQLKGLSGSASWTGGTAVRTWPRSSHAQLTRQDAKTRLELEFEPSHPVEKWGTVASPTPLITPGWILGNQIAVVCLDGTPEDRVPTWLNNISRKFRLLFFFSLYQMVCHRSKCQKVAGTFWKQN